MFSNFTVVYPKHYNLTMKYTVDKQDNYALFSLLEDKLDTRIAPGLKSEFVLMNSEGIRNIVLDLGTTRFIDSSGLSSILVANRLCNNVDGSLVLCGLTDYVKKMFEISHLDKVLTITDTKTDAIGSFVSTATTAVSAAAMTAGLGGFDVAEDIDDEDFDDDDDDDFDDDFDDEDFDDEEDEEEDEDDDEEDDEEDDEDDEEDDDEDFDDEDFDDDDFEEEEDGE